MRIIMDVFKLHLDCPVNPRTWPLGWSWNSYNGLPSGWFAAMFLFILSVLCIFIWTPNFHVCLRCFMLLKNA